jgi:hypothetical protein
VNQASISLVVLDKERSRVSIAWPIWVRQALRRINKMVQGIFSKSQVNLPKRANIMFLWVVLHKFGVEFNQKLTGDVLIKLRQRNTQRSGRFSVRIRPTFGRLTCNVFPYCDSLLFDVKSGVLVTN